MIKTRLDLTPTRGEFDSKDYHLLTLSNGLECLLVSSSSSPRFKTSDLLAEPDRVVVRAYRRSSAEDDEDEWDDDVPRALRNQTFSAMNAPKRSSSVVGIVSGDVGRKLSSVFIPEKASPRCHLGAGGRVSMMGENPVERPQAYRLSRTVVGDVRHSPVIGAHGPDTPGSRKHSSSLLLGGRDSLSSAAVVVPSVNARTHRTSLRSNSVASNRAMSLISAAAAQAMTLGDADMCAVAMGVSVGSFATPEGLDGLAHFLEHMLFMGSELHPKENELDSLLARVGGASNAFTDTERTVYHFAVPQRHVKECLNMFAQFFISPLLLSEASGRELNSIESEFALRQNIDGCRLQEIWRETSRAGTPYAKFTCGNLETLKIIPERNQIDVNAALREFHDRYYVTGNMKFVIVSSDPMDLLEKTVCESLKDVKSGPGEDVNIEGFPWRSPTLSTHPIVSSGNSGNASSVSNTGNASDAGISGGVGCIFRVVPTHDVHELQLTWQLPSQAKFYKSKPTDYISHLLGHESGGSVLAELKSRGWATGMIAGVAPDDGFSNNTGVTLFNVTISLTLAGLEQWIFAVGLLFEFIGILRENGIQEWIHDELRDLAATEYRFHEESDVRWLAQKLCVNMLPQTQFSRLDLLNGSSLVPEWNPQAIKEVLERLEPESVRVDLISSRLSEKPVIEQRKTFSDGLLDSTQSDSPEDEEFAKILLGERPGLREPIYERFTKAQYWRDPIPTPVTESWRACLVGSSTVGYAQLSGEEMFPRSLAVPPRNTFIASDFSLKSRRSYETSDHPLIGSELRLKKSSSREQSRHVSFTKRKSMIWELGLVMAHDKVTNSILIRFPAKEGYRSWHRLDHFNTAEVSKIKQFTMDSGRTLVKLSSSFSMRRDDGNPTTGESTDVRGEKHEEEEYGQVGSLLEGKPDPAWALFPRVPSAESTPWPALIAGSDEFFSLWHLHDVSFRSPRAHAYLNFLTPVMAETALSAALADLFAVLVFESLNQESYMAYIVDLDFEIEVTGGLGIQLHFSGFSHKLKDLFKIVLRRTLFFSQWVDGGVPPLHSSPTNKKQSTVSPNAVAGATAKNSFSEEFDSFFSSPDMDAPRNFDTPIFYARLEALMTDYINAGSRFCSGSQVSSVMFDMLCDGLWSPEEKCAAAKSITPSMFAEFSQKLFSTCKVEGLVQGNLDEEDAASFHRCVDGALRVRGSKPIRAGQEPRHRSVVVPVVQEKNQPVSGWIHVLEAVESSSHSVELFFQIGPDKPEDRVLAGAIEQMMREPLYTELRTKQQLGYSVKCGTRSVCGTLGFVVEITSDVHSPEVLAKDVDEFFLKFRAKLEATSKDEFVSHLCGMAAQLLEKPKNLLEIATMHWSCILSHVFYGVPYVWNSNLVNASLIKAVASKGRVLDAFDAWLNPQSGKRRRASVYVVGYGYDSNKMVVALRKPFVKLVAQPHHYVAKGSNLFKKKFSAAATLATTTPEVDVDAGQNGSASRRASVKCSIS